MTKDAITRMHCPQTFYQGEGKNCPLFKQNHWYFMLCRLETSSSACHATLKIMNKEDTFLPRKCFKACKRNNLSQHACVSVL